MKLLDVRFRFDENGKAQETVFFNVAASKDIYRNIDPGKTIEIESCVDESELCDRAITALSKLFYVVNESELADRDKYKLSVNPIEVVRNDAGIITEALIGVSLVEI